jgi:hypothetical protein
LLRTKNTLLSILSIALPCLLGIVAMAANGISPGIWIRNAAVIALLSLLSFLIPRPARQDLKLPNTMILCAAILLLLLPFFQEGVDGVRRWISVSFLSLHVSMLILPVSILALYNLLEEGKAVLFIVGALAISLLLFLQPDASQFTGFSVAIGCCMLQKNHGRAFPSAGKAIVCGALFVLSALSWRLSDNLPPVDYVEGVLALLGHVSSVLYLVGLLSLCLIPILLFALSSHPMKAPSLCIALYYASIIAAPLFGSYPVPFMGYGLSPIVGYFIALFCLTLQGGWSKENPKA